jgi:hypothetical protein
MPKSPANGNGGERRRRNGRLAVKKSVGDVHDNPLMDSASVF